ncbi:MAG: penicillin acylase family protein [Bacteroidales bacterium]|jgi:penicillin amidase|nr:penicillin acylase family protein [Bacteroidales bacterium]MDD3701504.1 penicillin acylase family protein [Bacteroidales bacterium]MDY0369231.1 penicillin acylase family protein [Bacteroidales bacterium]
MKKILFGILISLLLLLGLAFFTIHYFTSRALPNYNQSLVFEGLIDDVQVIRDLRAVPHIYAKNQHDLYMVTGYVMAQDRLWQMDLLRRVTMGRLSEIFGADMADTDQLLRALRMSQKSKMVLESSEPEIIMALEAFSKGVNQYIEQQKSKLPPEFLILGYKPEPWQPFHTLNLIGYMAWDLVDSWKSEIIVHKLAQKLPYELLQELLPQADLQPFYVHTTASQDSLFTLLESSEKLNRFSIEIFNASNNWAISGAHTASGKPLLANDMHLSFGLPGIWYQVHQSVEDTLQVSGVAVPGAPFIIAGHNDHIAWGMTNLYIDEIDFYKETLHPENPDLYLFNDQWLPLEIVPEAIITNKGDTIMRENRFTHRGPVISGFKKLKDEVVSMRWIGNEFSNEVRSVYKANRASDWYEFRDAFSSFGAVSQNIVYADIDGNIGMQSTGLVAIRKAGDAISVYPGDTDTYDWDGFLAFEELPFTFNPPEGMVSSANNRTVGPDYPHYLGYWFEIPARIKRIRELLNSTTKFTADDFKAIQLDQQSSFAADYRDEIVGILEQSHDKPEIVQKATEILRQWDLHYTADGTTPLLFDLFYIHFIKNVMSDELGDELYNEVISRLMRHNFIYFFANQQSIWIDDVTTPQRETFEDIVNKSFADAVADAAARLGENPAEWRWGKVHQLTLRHPLAKVKLLERLLGLNKGPFPVGGSFHTVNPMSYSLSDLFDVTSGASQRHIYDLSDWGASQVVIPTGTSGIPASKYYGSQIDDFLNGEYIIDLWEKDDIIESAVYESHFSPKN